MQVKLAIRERVEYGEAALVVVKMLANNSTSWEASIETAWEAAGVLLLNQCREHGTASQRGPLAGRQQSEERCSTAQNIGSPIPP